MNIRDNSIYFENKVTGKVVYLFWQDENRPDYANYMTVEGIKSISYKDMASDSKKAKEVRMAFLRYAESLGICKYIA